MSQTNPSQTPNAEKPLSKDQLEQAKTARENVSEGYGSTVKSRVVSAKPDGSEQGGPGVNNDQAKRP